MFRLLLALLTIGLLAPIAVGAASDIRLNPPSEPTPLGGAVLTYRRQVSVPRLTIPGQFSITETVGNTGVLAATNVAVRQELPPGWTVDGQSSMTLSLGDIAAGEQVVRTTVITVTTNAAAGRFANEAIVSANGLSSVEASAMIDLTRSAVLGASTLAETGVSAWPMLILGSSLLVVGWFSFQRARRPSF